MKLDSRQLRKQPNLQPFVYSLNSYDKNVRLKNKNGIAHLKK